MSSVFCHGQVKKNVSWLFPEDGDVDRAGVFFRNLLWTKEIMGQNTKSEASTFSKLLLKYTKQKDLCRVPACSARAWLVHIWQDVPSTRPNLDLLVICVVRWLADPCETQGRRFKRIPYKQRKSKPKTWSLKLSIWLFNFPISAGWASTFSWFNSWLNHRLLLSVCLVLDPLETLKE